MMKHSIDGRDVEMLVQIHEAFSQQVADHPREHKRAEHLLPPDGYHVAVEVEHGLIQEEKQQQGYVGKQHLIAHICPVHARKRKPVGNIRIRQSNQFRKMRKECHHDGDGIHDQQIFIVHDSLHAPKSGFGRHLTSRYIHTWTEVLERIQHTGIYLDGTVSAVHHLVDRYQHGLKVLISHAIHVKFKMVTHL